MINRLAALVAPCLAALMFGLEISSIPVILPTLGRELHADFVDLQWVMNAYTIACTTVLMAAGTLADRYGRRLVFVSSMTLFGGASLACGLARGAATLILSRAAQGAGGGAMLTCLIAILSHQFRNPAERARAFAVWGIVFGSGLGLGPIIGGLLAALVGWRWAFLVHVPITLVALVLVFVTIRESRVPRPRTLDIPGMLLLSLSILGLVCIFMEGPQFGFGNACIVALACGTPLSFMLFLFVERRTSCPLFEFFVFRSRRFTGAILGSVGVNFSFWPLMVYLPTLFQNGLGYGGQMTGLALLAYTLPVLVFPPAGEYLALRLHPRVVIPAGLFVTGAGLLVMMWGGTGPGATWLTLLPGCLLAGTGVGIANTPVTSTVTSSVPPKDAGLASGLDMTARLVTLAANIALMGFLLIHGVRSSLANTLSALDGPAKLQALAEHAVTGSPLESDLSVTVGRFSDVFHTALQHGFAAAMLYGGLGVWLLAGLSYAAFRAEPA